MRLAISNLAWDPTNEENLLPILVRSGVSGIEVAPTKLWPDWRSATRGAARDYRRRLADFGLAVPAMQAILFGRPELKLFGSSTQQQALVEHLLFIAELGNAFGVKVAVLGAPKNRDRGSIYLQDAIARAVELLKPVADNFAAHGVTLCIEPNPEVYGCNFITTSSEGVSLVRAVNSSGFGLHLDAAGMLLAGEMPGHTIPECISLLRHFHISEPMLADFSLPQVKHREIGSQLRALRYRGWVSIEMRQTESPKTSVLQAVQCAREWYINEAAASACVPLSDGRANSQGM